MAKQKVNKSALIRDYLGKHPDKSPKEIAELITADTGVSITPNFVSSVKVDLKPKKSTKKSKTKKKGAPTKKPAPKAAGAPAANGSAAVSQHVANLKSAALQLGKDEAKRIIDLLS